MDRTKTLLATLLISFLALSGLQNPAGSQETVDLELVLAVDVSLSMDVDEQRLQRDGYVAAFRDSSILDAIKSGPTGRIAVTYVEWAGRHIQSVVIPWHVIGSSNEAHAFADALAKNPIESALLTSISQAVLVSSRLFADSPVRGLRRIIDVSGDGPNNMGAPIERARDRVVASGIVINGLAIQIGSSSGMYTYFDLPDLDRYYEDCVIGGAGAFVLSIRDKREFARAIRQKLLLEIAGRTPRKPPRLWRAQHGTDAEKYDCLIGEKLWQQYLRSRGGDRP